MSYDTDILEFHKVLDMCKNYAKTDMAKDIILNLSPISNLETIKEMLDEIEEARKVIIKYEDIPLDGVKSILPSLKRAQVGGVLSIDEILNVSSLIKAVSNVVKYKGYLNANKIDITLLNKYFNELIIQSKLKTTIDTTIDENGYVVDNATNELFMLRKQLLSLQNRLRSKLNEIMSSNSSMLSSQMIVTRSNKLCLPYKVEYKNSIKGVILDESSSGTTVYIEPLACSIISSEIESTKLAIEKEINNILKNLSLFINSEYEGLVNNLNNLVSLDVIFAKALYANEFDMINPKINDKGYTKIIKGRHPLISKDLVVPTDIHFGDKFNTIIITGPNTGGKTVVLKLVGVLTLMMQSGMHVPCKEGSELAVFDDVFVDIGDEQSIEQSLSTFSSHMSKICNIVNKVGFNSLVLLDELGSGTDPKEGSSLAISIIEFLKARGSRVITTTHYGDLKAYAYMNKDICNASVEFNPQTLKPTYKLIMGIPGKSNALLIASRLGLDERIINRAKELNENRNTDTETLMDKLDIENSKISNIKDDYLHMISEYNQKIKEVDDLKNSIELERSKIIERATKEANDIILEAKNESLNLLNEIDKIRNDINVKEHEIADIKFVARNLKAKKIEDQVFDEDLKVGDYVYVKSYDKDGRILAIKKGKYEVQIGQFKMTFDKNELKLTKPPLATPKPKKPTHSISVSNAKMELDLRGYRYEAVREAVESFIDKALLANYEQVYIIHGFGTGVVREAVWACLKKCSHIKSYRYGKEGEGLNGVTVVYLR
ncbi:MAG: endonuclease MutS2 [Anaeroplasmataceae bacterium]